MKRLLKFLLFLITSSQMSAQVDYVENLMTRRYLSYDDIKYNVSFIIPEYYEKGNKDTLQSIIKFWEDRCGISEEIVRCKILLSIDDGSFSEIMYDDDILQMLRYYQKRHGLYDESDHKVQWSYTSDSYWDVYENRLNKFTVTLAKKLLKTKECTALEKFFLRIYANDSDQTFQTLDSDDFDGTRIKELYLRKKKKDEETVYPHNDWMIGIWIPKGNIELLGVHPLLGYRIGAKYKKWTADLSVGVKFIKSPNTYQVYKDNMIWDTDYFMGLYIGTDVSFELFRLRKSSIGIIGGIAYENIVTLDEEGPGDDKITHTLHSLNLNTGLGFKYNFKNKRYLGLDVKYNFVNFKNQNGTNLDGNTVTVSILIGNIMDFSSWW